MHKPANALHVLQGQRNNSKSGGGGGSHSYEFHIQQYCISTNKKINIYTHIQNIFYAHHGHQ